MEKILEENKLFIFKRWHIHIWKFLRNNNKLSTVGLDKKFLNIVKNIM
jgi:uncharacterized pyridoxamine 5'-phosphate oxidase family protein